MLSELILLELRFEQDFDLVLLHPQGTATWFCCIHKGLRPGSAASTRDFDLVLLHPQGTSTWFCCIHKESLWPFIIHLTGSVQVAMKYSTPGYQDIGKVLRDSLSDSSRIFFCNEFHFKHHNLKMRGQLTMLGSKSLNLKMRGHPSFLGFKSSPVSLNQNLEMKVLGAKSLLGSLVRKPKFVCKCLGSQDQLVSLIRKLTIRGVFASFILTPLIIAMFITRRRQLDCLSRVFKMRPAVASDSNVVIPAILIFVILCAGMDFMNLKPDRIVFTIGLASVLFSIVQKKVFESISSAILFYKHLDVGDFLRVKYNDSEFIGKVESVGLMSPLLIRDLSGEIHSISNDIFAGSVHVKMSVGTFKIISFRFVVSQNMAHKIDDIITNVDAIVKKILSNENEPVTNFSCVENMADNLKDVKILVSCLVKVDDVREYLRIKGAIILEVSKLLREVNAKVADSRMETTCLD